MNRIRVFLVDDTATVRHILSQILEEDPRIDVVGTAADGEQGLARLQRVDADILVLDVEMPGMGGLDMLRALRISRPELPVIVFSSITERGAMVTIEALSLGASDYVPKPAMVGSPAAARDYIRSTLLAKIHALADRPAVRQSRAPLREANPVATRQTRPDPTHSLLRPGPAGAPQRIDAVAIGVSMGGPNALGELFRRLPADLPVPVLIVQHMPAMFTRALAARLSQHGRIPVTECDAPMPVLPGRTLLAAGDYHLCLDRDGDTVWARPRYSDPVNFCRPSADVLFNTAAEVYGRHLLAVVMTGMGQDGLDGCRAVNRAGGQIIVQDESSSIVWGMAGSVARAGLAEQQVPLAQLAEEIVMRVEPGRLWAREA
ncbi:MAG: chemotaxis-specific protein-glutamate methyltransferase CheB [Alcanivoracaceae bacterium]